MAPSTTSSHPPQGGPEPTHKRPFTPEDRQPSSTVEDFTLKGEPFTATVTHVNQIRVAIVNDYQVVVEGVAAMLRCYGDRVTVVELDAGTEVSRPVDIALYDTFAVLPGSDGEIRRLVEDGRARRVAIYSWNLDHRLMEDSRDNGADAYLSKELPAAELVEALIAVHTGLQPDGARPHRAAGLVGNDWPGREEGLTLRESEVLALITEGLSNDEIAEDLHLSVNSVKTHIRTCYRRIGVTNRANAVLWGIDHGFRRPAKAESNEERWDT